MLPSASSLQRAFACVASTALPKFDSVSEPAGKGTAKHAYLANLRRMTREQALALVEPEYLEVCEAINVDDLPADMLEEVALVYDIETETVRYLGQNIGRDYGLLASTEIPMSIDVAGGDGELVFAGDYKTGAGRQVRAAKNWQLRVAALAMARWKGAEKARVAIILVRDDGEPYYDAAEFDAFDLADIAADLRALGARIKAEREHVAGGAMPRATTGDHCRYCPSFTVCPAQTAIIRQVVGDPQALATSIVNALTPETAAKAYEQVKLAREVMKQAEAALYAYASQHPIPLGDGEFFGPVEKEVEQLDPEVVRQVLGKLHGGEVAERACTFETSKAGVERAVRTVYEARKAAGEKVTIKGLLAEALAATREARGVQVKKRTEIREHRETPSVH